VAKGDYDQDNYDQEQGIDYYETFAPVIKQQSLRLFLAMSLKKKPIIHHEDISTASVNGILEEEVYIETPDGQKEIFQTMKF
jgi:hypothetical protein